MSDNNFFNFKIGEIVINSKHADKLYWKEVHITKMDLMKYYDSIGDIIIPFLKNRPLTLHYFPYGIDGLSFYKRDFELNISEDLIKTFSYKEKTTNKLINVPTIKNKAGLVYLASRGCLALHAWGSKFPDFTYPDLAIFDLDISNSIDFSKVIKVANLIHKKLIAKKIKSYPKTSGGTGMHIYVPIDSIYSFEYVRSWVSGIGEELSNEFPKLITTIKHQRKSHSGNKVVIDYLQNAISRNTAIPYTPRANIEAKVSTPLYWEEVEKGGFTPEDFTLKNILSRIKNLGDPFKDIFKNPQKI